MCVFLLGGVSLQHHGQRHSSSSSCFKQTRSDPADAVRLAKSADAFSFYFAHKENNNAHAHTLHCTQQQQLANPLHTGDIVSCLQDVIALFFFCPPSLSLSLSLSLCLVSFTSSPLFTGSQSCDLSTTSSHIPEMWGWEEEEEVA